jgi:hypothetical protein
LASGADTTLHGMLFRADRDAAVRRAAAEA